MTHNGWTNYETWAANLWLTNDEETYNHCRALASEARDEAVDTENVRSGIWTVQEASRFRLAELLKAQVEEGNPIADQATLYVDLLNAALSEVKWSEIAEAFLDEI